MLDSWDHWAEAGFRVLGVMAAAHSSFSVESLGKLGIKKSPWHLSLPMPGPVLLLLLIRFAGFFSDSYVITEARVAPSSFDLTHLAPGCSTSLEGKLLPPKLLSHLSLGF